jgi:hypothetical protein
MMMMRHNADKLHNNGNSHVCCKLDTSTINTCDVVVGVVSIVVVVVVVVVVDEL